MDLTEINDRSKQIKTNGMLDVGIQILGRISLTSTKPNKLPDFVFVNKMPLGIPELDYLSDNISENVSKIASITISKIGVDEVAQHAKFRPDHSKHLVFEKKLVEYAR